MSIKKIKSISNMAVFPTFDWSRSVLDKQNNVIEFKKINVLYGRNYSGKTTLSRIIRALETREISDKYIGADFKIEIEGDGDISLNNIDNNNQIVRVFNEDFVRESLKFFIDDSDCIQSFAILGDENLDIEKKIAIKEAELGSEIPHIGLKGEMNKKSEAKNQTAKAYLKMQTDIDNLLRNKANNEIKTNLEYNVLNYNINKLKLDIDTVLGKAFVGLTSTEVGQLQALLKDIPKEKIDEMPKMELSMKALIEDVNLLVSKKINLTTSIKELIEDSLLESWVRAGVTHHKDKRDTCGFCGNYLPKDLMDKLDKHFNKESEDLRIALEERVENINKIIDTTSTWIQFDNNKFYATERDEISRMEKRFKEFVSSYIEILKIMISQLELRLKSISLPIAITDYKDITCELDELITEYNEIIVKTNAKTATLSKSQEEARKNLRLNEVKTFINTISYSNKLIELTDLETKKNNAQKSFEDAKEKVVSCFTEIKDLKSQLKDERKGADQVNAYLNNYFGHNSLKLVPVDDESDSGKFKFEIQRNGEKAFHLSEGECSLVSFCYFMAKLKDVNTKDHETIIWIDDPISSLDSNHVFFIYSLIKGEIVRTNKFKQLFISTHNLDFLKYLKRLVSDRDYGKKVLNLIVQRCENESTISEMPEYMVKYVTEFNYLFHKIYQCANIDVSGTPDLTLFYDFGNNSRKFMELLLSFKYPNPNKSDDKKLEDFLGEGSVEALLVSRINNEYSHLQGVFERGIIPVEIPEMKKAAQFILDKLYENDKVQFNSLLESIGEIPRD